MTIKKYSENEAIMLQRRIQKFRKEIKDTSRGDSHIKRAGMLVGKFQKNPKRYYSGCGLRGILPLKDTNQKHRDKHLSSINLYQ